MSSYVTLNIYLYGFLNQFSNLSVVFHYPIEIFLNYGLNRFKTDFRKPVFTLCTLKSINVSFVTRNVD